MAKRNISNERESIGTGYIVIPQQVDREVYIQYCKNTEQVTILTEQGEYISNVFVSTHIMNSLVYPATFEALGSLVVYLNTPFHNKPIITGVLSKQGESQLVGEGEMKFSRRVGANSVEIYGSAKDGVVNIVLDSKTKANFNIICLGEESSLNIQSNGNLTVKSSKNITVGSFEDLTISSQNVLEDKLSKIYLKDGKITLNEGTEPMLLGDTTVEQLEKEKAAIDSVLDAFSNLIPVPVAPGAIDGTWATLQGVLAAIVDRGDFSGVKSENSSLD